MESNVKVEVNDIDVEDGQPSTVKPTSKALSDGSRDETPTPTYKHSWTVEQRLTLAMLAETYSNDWNHKTSVFNHVHRSDLPRGGLRRAVINTQFNDMRKRFNAADALRKLQARLSPYDRSKLVSRAGLERKAHEIGIQLCEKDPTDSSRMSDKHNAPGDKRKRAESINDERTDFFPHRSDDGSQIVSHLRTVHGLTLLPKTPTKINGKQQNNGLLTPPDSRERKIPCLTVDNKLARIGFRASTAQSQGKHSTVFGIRAGSFLNRPTVPLARNLEGASYIKEVLHHITKHDHSRPSMFVSVTKNPMRALHMLLHAPQGEKNLILIDLNVADERGNVQKAHQLKLRTDFRYTAAGEYLIFGGVEPEAIISHIDLSKILSNMPKTADSDDPFCFKVLQAHQKLSHARRMIKKETLPMTYSLGRAVGELVGVLCIPPKHFESGVWSLVQDYKFYNAEGGRKSQHWSDNVAFKDGAVQGYQAIQSGNMASFEIEDNIRSAREIIEIDSGSDQADSVSSDEDGPIPMDVENWVRTTQAHQASLQYYDLDTSKWTTRGEDLSDDFLVELRDIASTLNYNGPEMNGNTMVEDRMGPSESDRQNTAANLSSNGPRVDTDAVIDEGLAVTSRDHLQRFENIDELCADVLHMHGHGDIDLGSAADTMEIGYEFGWTGM